MFLIKAYADGWVTIKGVHVFIGPSGRIDKGPAKFIGSRPEDLGVKTPDSVKNSASGGSGKSTGGSKSTTKKNTKKTTSGTKKTTKKTGGTSTNKTTAEKPSSNSKSVNSLGLEVDSIGRAVNTTGKTLVAQAWGKTIIFKPGVTMYNVNSYDKLEYADSSSVKSTDTEKAMGRISATTGEKYPSSVKTTAEKRAYTRARNDGLSRKEAETFATGTKKHAVGGFTPSMNKKLNTYIEMGYSPDEATDIVLRQSGYGLGSRRGMSR